MLLSIHHFSMVWRTTFITISTCFLLGATFTHWIADHNVMWTDPATPEALSTSITYYSLLSSAPPSMIWIYTFAGFTALASVAGRLRKGWNGRSGVILFDGGSVVLLASLTYTQISDVLPTIASFPHPLPPNITDHLLYKSLAGSVRELASDNLMCAVILTGVMLLQAGRYYAKTRSNAPTQSPAVEPPASPFAARAATPFRELTEDEALELRDSGRPA